MANGNYTLAPSDISAIPFPTISPKKRGRRRGGAERNEADERWPMVITP